MESFNYTILVVDDEELVRRVIVTFLSQLGYSCITATDGVDALEKMDANKMDAVITDIKMPKMDGIILTKEISTKYPGLPVMVMTAFDEEYSAGVAISFGAREFIKKPFSLDEFAIRFRKMIGDLETLKRMKSGKDVDENIQKPRNELETLKPAKSTVERDKQIQEFIDEMETLSQMRRAKERNGNLEESKDQSEKTFKKC
jgi:CheY-like chemotaxis protein